MTNNTSEHIGRRDFLQLGAAAVAAGGLAGLPAHWQKIVANTALADELPVDYEQLHPDSMDPVLSKMFGRDVRIPNSCPAIDGSPNLHEDALEFAPLLTTHSLTGNPIKSLHDPLQDLELALYKIEKACKAPEYRPAYVQAAARDVLDILKGDTRGRVYDGFPLLNYNRRKTLRDQVAGEYKTKRLRDSGETIVSQIDGEIHKVWEVDYSMLWYGHNFDSDMYLLRIPFEAHPYDEIRINWRIYSLIQEDLSPSTITNDGFGRIYHGLDSSFESIPANTLSELTIRYPSVLHLRGIYVWGWGVHPPRVQFLQPIYEADENGGLIPASESFSWRTANDLTLDAISNVAPEKKAFRVAVAALEGAGRSQLLAMLTDGEIEPRGSYREWLRLAADQRQLPPEAWDTLAAEDGLNYGQFGDYDIVLAYMNNEIYGDTPYAQYGAEGKGGVVKDWAQGEIMRVKVINFDNHTHYYRNVDFGAQLIHENKKAFGNGKFSFEKFSPKPSYGVPKIAEMQWRTGWGYVPHLGIAGQPGLFPRPKDRLLIRPFLDQLNATHYGYVFRNVSGYWRFNPPAVIREGATIMAGNPLRESDGEDGVLISFDAEAFGTAKMPLTGITTHPNQDDFPRVVHPGFLKNPGSGGDIIPPTPVWVPFLSHNPETGTLWDPQGNYWVDQTFMHGRPVAASASIVANVEAPRAGAQLFYQFDPLFHDNMIFSYHPRSDTNR
jgi:hypothetical protein